MSDRHYGPEHVADLAKNEKLKPKEEHFIGRKGYERKYRPDGSYKWRYKFKPNDQGKETREGAMVKEMLRPWQRAEAERSAKNQAMVERVAQRDRDGQIHYVDAALADATARKAGRSHAWRAGGVRAERGIDGMWFRLIRDEWEPTGRLEIKTCGKRCPRGGIQRDPDGNRWAYFAGAWRRA